MQKGAPQEDAAFIDLEKTFHYLREEKRVIKRKGGDAGLCAIWS